MEKISARKAGLFTGPLIFILITFIPDTPVLKPEAIYVLATAALMAIWWITEAIPIPATALLPIILFPAFGVMSGSEVTQPYANHLIYLFLGGFLIAVTIEKWNLHQRIALHTIRLVGVTPNRIILGFMLATALLSMWISNTAATMMMVTIGLAVLNQVKNEIKKSPALNIDLSTGQFNFGTALMLGIGYSASIGGVATLIGTPPNAILAGILETNYGISINFLDWMLFALPLSSLMLILTWYYLTYMAYPSEINFLPGGHNMIQQNIEDLGHMSREEKSVLAVFVMVALLWILRGLIDSDELAYIKDSTIAMIGAMLLFIFPSNLRKGEFLLDWQTALKIPWDILILFGGGFALARGFSDSGLTLAIAGQINLLQGVNIVLIFFTVTTIVIFLTEITSNTATASLFLPVIGAVAIAMQIHPMALMFTVAIAASYAFMLPVATPPNAIVFGSRYISIQQMVKTGIWVNLYGIILITCFTVFFIPLIWDIVLDKVPPGFLLQIKH